MYLSNNKFIKNLLSNSEDETCGQRDTLISHFVFILFTSYKEHIKWFPVL